MKNALKSFAVWALPSCAIERLRTLYALSRVRSGNKLLLEVRNKAQMHAPSSEAPDDVLGIGERRLALADIDGLARQLDKISGFRAWKRETHAICYYGSDRYAANVRFAGLKSASDSWGIPYFVIFHGQESLLGDVTAKYRNLLIIVSHPTFLPRIRRYYRRGNSKIVVFARYLSNPPRENLAAPENEMDALREYKNDIVLAVSELSQEGNSIFMSRYVKELGVPVMTFPWGVDVYHHHPVAAPEEKSVLFIGTYGEKAARINDYFERVLRRHDHSIIGPDWGRSPFPGLKDMIVDTKTFLTMAKYMYSSHTVSLNIHHDYEIRGYSCNERVFNAPACGGFVISDNARRIGEFFGPTEMVVAGTPAEYAERVAFYVANPGKRTPYIKAILRKIYQRHTYHHRLTDLISVVFSGRSISSSCPVWRG